MWGLCRWVPRPQGQAADVGPVRRFQALCPQDSSVNAICLTRAVCRLGTRSSMHPVVRFNSRHV
jgi:hypothetical protein